VPNSTDAADSRRRWLKISAAAAFGAPVTYIGGGGATKNSARPARRRALIGTYSYRLLPVAWPAVSKHWSDSPLTGYRIKKIGITHVAVFLSNGLRKPFFFVKSCYFNSWTPFWLRSTWSILYSFGCLSSVIVGERVNISRCTVWYWRLR